MMMNFDSTQDQFKTQKCLNHDAAAAAADVMLTYS
jgi:hypothetical protein